MICGTCDHEFSGQKHHGVPLTIVCSQCVTSSDLITKTDALSAGASQSDLYRIRRLYAPNPHYRNGADMQLFVREEVEVVVKIATDSRRRKTEEADRKRHLLEARQQAVKKSRLSSLAKRMQSLNGMVPTQGLVAGDFCTVESKTPKVGVRTVLARRALWNGLSGVGVPQKVMLFEWAVTNKRLSSGPASLAEGVLREKHFFDRVATVEGNRVLSFLDEVDRLVLLRLSPIFSEGIYDLPVRPLSDRWVSLCDEVAVRLRLPFGRVLTRLCDSENCWIHRYMFVLRPERVAQIMAPHFHAPQKRQRLLTRDMEESFGRWGLDPADRHHRADDACNYFRGDVVDVELYSATCAILKAHIHYEQAAGEVTNRVMSTPGATWQQVTREYIEEQLANRRERQLMRSGGRLNSPSSCRCGNPAAMECVFDQCGRCCRGPCDRHRRY